jgi:hypothetical protein
MGRLLFFGLTSDFARVAVVTSHKPEKVGDHEVVDPPSEAEKRSPISGPRGWQISRHPSLQSLCHCSSQVPAPHFTQSLQPLTSPSLLQKCFDEHALD